jgi:hypothetical protein
MSDQQQSVRSNGDAAIAAKRLLNLHLFRLPPLANFHAFDSDTRTRVIDVQRMSRLHPDGIISRLTTRRLVKRRDLVARPETVQSDAKRAEVWRNIGKCFAPFRSQS